MRSSTLMQYYTSSTHTKKKNQPNNLRKMLRISDHSNFHFPQKLPQKTSQIFQRETSMQLLNFQKMKNKVNDEKQDKMTQNRS